MPKTQPRPTSWQSDAGKNYVSWVLFSTCNWSKLIVIAFLIAFLSFSCLDQWLCEQPASSSPCTATVTLKELFCVSATSTSSEMARYSSRALTDHWYIWYHLIYHWYLVIYSWKPLRTFWHILNEFLPQKVWHHVLRTRRNAPNAEKHMAEKPSEIWTCQFLGYVESVIGSRARLEKIFGKNHAPRFC